ncbi:MAG: phage head morphogenesis protein [Treponema sp.]|jgi:hypothetical protein|nr:phage head morphogenesis protein [Treponema sp.]
MGMDHAARKINAADTEIPPLPFEEAVSFMKGRVPMTKPEWDELEPKLRFRAFTVARLAQCDFIETVRGRLVNAMEKGEGFASTWKDIKAIAEADGAFQFRPGYWENVFRTNTQTAYTAGKLMQYRNNPPPAWNLLIVDDSRTSDICRGLIHSGKQSLAMPSNHPFWEKFGFPPYHFQCRTGLQAVYSSQIGTDIQVENPTMKSLGKHFKPMEGFGGNPLENGNYWMMTKEMFNRGLRYGIINEFNQLDNIVKDFDSVWKEYSREKFVNGWVDVHKNVIDTDEFQKNYEMAKKLAADGERVKIIPTHTGKGIKGWKNPDYLMNGSLWEYAKINGSKSSIKNAFKREADQARNIVILVPSDADKNMLLRYINGRFNNKKSPSIIRNLILYIGDERHIWP